MRAKEILAHEIYVKHLFSDKFLFEIPNFQRPFAWEKENFEQLFSDIKDALQTNLETFGNKIDDYESYFLGSIILCAKQLKDDGSGEYAIIDGQQRLVSLAILIAVMRDLLEDNKRKNRLQNKIYQERDDDIGTPERVRIKMRDKEEEFGNYK